ncbi:hypothetical protein, partial [Enhygromyxa salina]|uniref:hypothetical protein n=1 Tax=Enhygromyxa salina TaxID=215803 RepID=UPI001C62B691
GGGGGGLATTSTRNSSRSLPLNILSWSVPSSWFFPLTELRLHHSIAQQVILRAKLTVPAGTNDSQTCWFFYQTKALIPVVRGVGCVEVFHCDP